MEISILDEQFLLWLPIFPEPLWTSA